MRPRLFLAIIGVFLLASFLASCGGSPTDTPTATPVPPTEPAATAESTDTVALPNADDLSDFAGTVSVPIPGTLSVANTGETPNAPTRAPISLDLLVFSQTGGLANVNEVIELHGDGTLIHNGASSTVGQDKIQAITDMLNQIHFYDINGTFIDASGAADAYHYSLTVQSDQGSRTIFSQDGLTPQELSDVYDAIRALVQ